MLFVTRNQTEAFNFVNSLSFLEDYEKARVCSYFGSLKNFMDEVKEKKKFNSKGWEKWFVNRIQNNLEKNKEAISKLLKGHQDEESLRESFILQQNTIVETVKEICVECDVTPRITKDMHDYCEFLVSLSKPKPQSQLSYNEVEADFSQIEDEDEDLENDEEDDVSDSELDGLVFELFKEHSKRYSGDHLVKRIQEDLETEHGLEISEEQIRPQVKKLEESN